MIPQYVRQVAPEARVPRLAGLGARADAGIGQALGQLGVSVAAAAQERIHRGDALAASRAWRQLDEWRIGYLRELPRRRATLAAVTVDEISGANVTGYEKELEAFPDALKAKFQEIAQGLSPDARARLETAYNQASVQWSQQVVTALEGMELADITTEARSLASQGRTADAQELLDLYKDRLGPEAHAQLASELMVSGAQSDLQQIAGVDGWQKARETLQDPQWQAIYGLDVAEAHKIRLALEGFVAEEQAKAARIHAMEQQALERQRIDQAYQGTVDMDQARAEYLSGQLTEKAYETIRRLDVQGARTENDPRTYAQLIAMEDAVQRGARPAADLEDFAKANADKLKRSTYESAMAMALNPFSMQVQAKNDAVQRAYGQFVRVQETDLEALLMQGASNEAMRSAGDARAHQLNLVNMLSDELEEWIQKNPDATRAEILRQGRMIQVQIAQRTIQEQDSLIRQWEASAGGMPGPEAAGVAGNLGNLRKIQPSAVPQSSAPAGLESIWDQLDSEAKADVMRLLARGLTAADILRIWQEKP